ncbi:MAG: hypothetical protein KAT77_04940 [Nanoarchaeota archaeon]|nr:hypothetical protein [Nanoarchaeota archaeon]
MTLEDKVIVKTEDVKKLYQRAPDKYIKPIEELGFLPLTVKDLCTEPGQALLHLASWVYLSGGLHPTKYRPHVSQSIDLLEILQNEKLAALEQEYKIPERDNRTHLELKTNSGIFGRLLYAMGVPLPEGTNRSRKPYYSKDLPHFIKDIMDSRPAKSEVEERKNLLTTIATILFKDRFKKRTDEWEKDYYVLRLNHHETEEHALNYGIEIINLLNAVFKKKYGRNPFNDKMIETQERSDNGLYRCQLSFFSKQMGYLVTKAPHILEPLKVNY